MLICLFVDLIIWLFAVRQAHRTGQSFRQSHGATQTAEQKKSAYIDDVGVL